MIAADANKCLQQIKFYVIPHTYSSLSESLSKYQRIKQHKNNVFYITNLPLIYVYMSKEQTVHINEVINKIKNRQISNRQWDKELSRQIYGETEN